MLPPNAALLIIDVQKAIDHPSWGRRNNPQAEENISRLLSTWRRTGRPVHPSLTLRAPYADTRVSAAGAFTAVRAWFVSASAAVMALRRVFAA